MPAYHFIARLLPAALLAAAPLLSAAQAAGNTQRVEILSAQAADAPRRDVATVCPNIADELPEILASAWQQVGQPGTVRVQFTLDGDKVVAVTPTSGPRRYHRWVRSAMNDVTCRSDRAQVQAFQLDIRFVDIYDTPDRRAVAVLMP